ncbi:MAG: T9SS type A sorting domain-containing protein [bacterium]
MITSVEERQVSTTVPHDFTLSQNYPNPFNPTTSIDYTVEQTRHVRLTVYNLLGQKVGTLAEGIRPAGNYTITWDASTLASGIYIYRLEAGATVLTKKMTLLK